MTSHHLPKSDSRKPSLTVVITAYNEETTIEKTFLTTLDALRSTVSDYEILMIDDASKDRSGAIIGRLAREYPHTRAVYNPLNLNQGNCYKRSIELARKEYHCLLPGDNMVEGESLKRLFASTGQADMSLIYIANKGVRHPLRWVFSEGFVSALNLLFGFKLKYYNSPVVIKTSLLKNLKLSGSFAFSAESIIPLLFQKRSYVVVPMVFIKDKKEANLKTIRRNFFPVVVAILSLFWRIRIRGERH